MNTRKIFLCLLAIIGLCSACRQEAKRFTLLSAGSSGIDFANQLEKRKGFSILYYIYYYNGAGVATGDINNDGLPDIYFTANSKGHNKLYLNKGNFTFEDITSQAGVAGTADWCTGVTMADVNGDGYLDIYVCAVQGMYGLQGRNQLFINNGKNAIAGKTPMFTESAAALGLDVAAFSTQAAFFDYDHDGDLDCYIVNQSHHPNQNITDTINRRKVDDHAGDRLYRNDISSTGRFTDVSAAAGIYQGNLGYGLGLAVADLNNDGWDDIYVGNDFHENDYYYINSGKGTFTDGSYTHFRHFSRFSMGNDIADYDNDGQPDVITVDMLPPDEKVLKNYGSNEELQAYRQKITRNGYQYQYSRNCLQHNNGNGTSFSDVALATGVAATDWSWTPLLADFDNDGNKDLFISSGIVKRPMDLDYVRFVSNLSLKQAAAHSDEFDELALEKSPEGSSYCYLYAGDGKGGFTDRGKDWGIQGQKGFYNGAAYADFDNDGDLDLVVNALNGPALLYRNNSTGNHYTSISLQGEGMNRNGIGTKVYVYAGGQLQYQQQMLTRGFQSSVAPGLHIGLGNATTIDSLLVVWPNQYCELLKNLPADKPLTLQQKNATTAFVYAAHFTTPTPALQDITAQVQCSWQHREDAFTDFNSQYLIPHEQSTRGPKMAVADVNSDGLDDIYLCGARGQGGTLLVQNKNGAFIPTDTTVFNAAKTSEGVDAVFFDANADGHPDLYVVSGGNEYADGDPALNDHLYINNGKGGFKEATDALPGIRVNKSTVAVADIDKDGDQDLFVGGLADARRYGYPQSGYLLLNDGKGKFTLAGNTIINLQQIGITTAASFADINKDGWPDLLVTGEWMPVKLFINQQGHFTSTDLPGTTGLWQSLMVTDINADGNPDILAGNWGHNSKLWSGKDGPLKLYIKDFDRNGSIEQIMCYTIAGKEYTFLAKDELEQALPVLKKGYLTYNEVAGKTVQYLFDDLFKDYTTLQAETLSSSLFMGDGKGGFIRTDLPAALQLAPLFAFAALPHQQWLAAGNFYGVLPYEGRYDAQQPTLFGWQQGQSKTNGLLPEVTGEVRDAKWVRTARYGRLLVLARNNQPLLFYTNASNK